MFCSKCIIQIESIGQTFLVTTAEKNLILVTCIKLAIFIT